MDGIDSGHGDLERDFLYPLVGAGVGTRLDGEASMILSGIPFMQALALAGVIHGMADLDGEAFMILSGDLHFTGVDLQELTTEASTEVDIMDLLGARELEEM